MEIKKKEVAVTLPKVDPATNQPCNWHIKEVDGRIEAKNTLSGMLFEGTLEDFNKILRG